MKRELAWHKECLNNQRSYLLRLIDEERGAIEAVARCRASINAYDAQITEAELRGVDGFDRDKFGKKRDRSK